MNGDGVEERKDREDSLERKGSEEKKERLLSKEEEYSIKSVLVIQDQRLFDKGLARVRDMAYAEEEEKKAIVDEFE